jgi:hypothetical protein
VGGFEAEFSDLVEPFLKYHPVLVCGLTPIPMKGGTGDMYAGRFDWGGLLLKGNGGAQWLGVSLMETVC